MRCVSLALLAALAACGSTKPDSDSAADTRDADCKAAITRCRNGGGAKWFDTAHGYAVFPSVGKAGFIVGGAHGKGQVYEQGKVVGFTAITQGTLGLQAGAQSFSEIIFFKDKTAFAAFQEGNYELDAGATAVAADKGASAQADYSKGVAIFVFGEGGLMAGATVGGQKFSYEPK